MSQIITLPVSHSCDFCNNEMVKIEAGRNTYKCLNCGAKEDNY